VSRAEKQWPKSSIARPTMASTTNAVSIDRHPGPPRAAYMTAEELTRGLVNGLLAGREAGKIPGTGTGLGPLLVLDKKGS
jgi:hypothetical protein